MKKTTITKKEAKKQTTKMVKQLIKQMFTAKEIERLVDKAFASGVIDYTHDSYQSSYSNKPELNFRLPKHVAVALARQMEFQYSPISGDNQSAKLIKAIYGSL